MTEVFAGMLRQKREEMGFSLIKLGVASGITHPGILRAEQNKKSFTPLIFQRCGTKYREKEI